MQYSRLTWFYCIIFLMCFQITVAQSVFINEFMSDNESSILDDDGESSDWIELYNFSNESISLNGYHLSDDNEDLQKWKFPNIEIGANQFLLIFASGKDKTNDTYLHTNFKISSDGEELILSNSSGVRIDEYEEVELSEDQSFGRVPDGGTNKSILYKSSPGSSNNESNFLSFSHGAGFYTKSFDLSITSLLNDTIYYTLDGSEPTTSSAIYTDKIPLKNKTTTPNVWSEIPTTPTDAWLTNPVWQSPGFLVTKANIIRCATFRNNVKTSKTYSQTVLIANDVFEKYDMPIISLMTEGSNFFDNEDGIYVPGIDYDPEVPEWTGNYFRKDIEAERPIHIEYFDLDGNLGFSQDAGVRIHGGKTRHGAQKSLKLYAREEYGKKYFRYQLMPQKEVDNYERFLLQTTTGAWGGDSVIKDILSHEIVRDMDFEKMDYQPTIVFLNGEYWGIHHIRDRMDEEYLAYTSGLDKDSLEIDTGGNSHYNGLIDYIKEHLPIDNEEYLHISNQMEIDAYIDYQIAEMYLNNFDWPSNNTKHWRPKKADGKWRWMFYDLDGGFRDYNYDMVVHNTNDDPDVGWPNNPRSTLLFRALIANEIFQEKFLARYKELIENDFRSSITKAKLNTLVDQYIYEMPNHIARWHFPPSMDTWLDDIDSELVEFLVKRSCAVKEHIESYFELDNYDVVCKDLADTTFQPNKTFDITLSPNPNYGEFYIKNNSSERRIVEIGLYNSIGQIVFNLKNILLLPSENYSISENQIPSGIYALKIQDLENTVTFQIVVMN